MLRSTSPVHSNIVPHSILSPHSSSLIFLTVQEKHVRCAFSSICSHRHSFSSISNLLVVIFPLNPKDRIRQQKLQICEHKLRWVSDKIVLLIHLLVSNPSQIWLLQKPITLFPIVTCFFFLLSFYNAGVKRAILPNCWYCIMCRLHLHVFRGSEGRFQLLPGTKLGFCPEKWNSVYGG